VPKLIPLSQKRITYAVTTDGNCRKIFQSIFLRDGSLTVHFPYFRDSTGYLAVGRIPPGKSFLAKLTLEREDARCTSHRVKYSHHLDGRAHFSQDGRVYTAIKRNAVPLRNANGHLFTLKAQHIGEFSAAPKKDINSPQKVRGLIDFVLPTDASAVQFIGWIYKRADFEQRFSPLSSKSVGPIVDIMHPQRGQIKGVISRNPDSSDGTILLVTAEPIEPMTTSGAASLSFVGGFDPPEIAFDHSLPSEFLFMGCPYPDADTTMMVKSADFTKPARST